jgi:hypothetical protein
MVRLYDNDNEESLEKIKKSNLSDHVSNAQGFDEANEYFPSP